MGVLFPSFPAYDVETLRNRLALASEETRRVTAQLEAMTIKRDELRAERQRVYALLYELGGMFDAIAAASPTGGKLFKDMHQVRILRAMVLEDCRSRTGRQ